ncbi:MAG: ferredoxin [Fastidiosipilaceae bacterium]|jgi:ferredoxin
MKATVDHDLCIGCGICASMCPEVFEMGDDGLAHVIAEVTPELEAGAQEAEAACPTEAITVE